MMVSNIQTEHQLLGQMIKSYPDYALYEFHLIVSDYLILLIFVPIYLFVRKPFTLLVIISL